MILKCWLNRYFQFGLMGWVGMGGAIAWVNPTASQVVPDATLGGERSIVAPLDQATDRIDGGALRGINLFHSFEQFNVGAGRSVYFANPTDVENILSRVSGSNRSDILGRLGVLGNANLFLLNPNGIVFGLNATLDVAGSFTASTASAIALGNQGFFSATQPQHSRLLAIVPGALFFDQQLRQPRTIQNSGNLTTGLDLTLSADNLELQGKLRSGGSLSLQAQDTLRIRDSATVPFIASAGGKLLVQGDRSVDIFALNHPDSGLFSGTNMVLRSANAVSGDAHYYSGGSFRVEQLDGQLGGLLSPHDPVVRASGDVAAANYIGASLHIFAGGSVTISDFVWIQGADTVNGLADSVQLSDNTSVSINGRMQPTLDIRAGTTAVGNPFADTGTPTNANITLGTIFFFDPTFTTQIAGKIVLTNQYQPNASLSGSIQVSETLGNLFPGQAIVNGGFEGGGSTTLDSRSSIVLNGGIRSNTVLSPDGVPLGNGGDVTLLAHQDIALAAGSVINSSGLLGGTLTFKSGGNITSSGGSIASLSFSSTPGLEGGNINLNAGSLSLTNSLLTTSTYGQAKAGNININVTGAVTLTGINGTVSGIQSNIEPGAVASGGNVNITAGSLTLNGAQVQAFVREPSVAEDGTVLVPAGQGEAGTININVEEAITLGGINGPFTSLINSALNLGARGRGGDIFLSAGSLTLTDGARILSSTFGQGDAGNVTVNVRGEAILSGVVVTPVQVSSSGIQSNVESGAVGNGGDIEIHTGSLSLTNGAQIQTIVRRPFFASDGAVLLPAGQGEAGDVRINARNAVIVDGTGTVSSNGATAVFSTLIASALDAGATGKAGDITITADSLSILNGARLTSSTGGQGDAGDIRIEIQRPFIISGAENGFLSGAYSTVDYGAIGNGGDIEVTAGSLLMTNGAQIQTIVSQPFRFNGVVIFPGGRGEAGDVTIDIRDHVALDGTSPTIRQLDGTLVSFSSQVASALDFGTAGTAGDITLKAGSLSLSNGARLSSGTFGQGNAGNVLVTVREAATFDGVGSNGVVSGIESQVQPTAIGNGGNLTLSAGSLTVTNGAQLNSSTFGQGDAGDVTLTVREVATFDGVGSNGAPSNAGSQVALTGIGRGGNVTLSAGSLTVTNGAQLNSSTFGQGDAGDVTLTIREAASFDGVGSTGFSSNAGSQVIDTGVGKGGNLTLSAGSLTVTNGAQLSSSTFGQGDAGDVTLTVRDAASFDGVGSNGASSSAGNQVALTGIGKGGSLTLSAGSLTLTNGALLSSSAFGQGDAGEIVLRVSDQLKLVDSNITTFAFLTSGGSIDIMARAIRLSGNSNILTNVLSGVGNGGDITLTATAIIALNDSNILASARDGKGGNITFNTRAFFGQNYRPAPPGTDLLTFFGNGRVDVNASGAVSGIITLPDVSFLQNSLTEFPQTFTDTNQLLANSCIVRSAKQNGRFVITGSGGLPQRPGDAPLSSFPTGEVKGVRGEERGVRGEEGQGESDSIQNSAIGAQQVPDRPWKIGDPIVEPQGIYQLANGDLVMSRECP